jgi:CheY-like chemotaxis protein
MTSNMNQIVLIIEDDADLQRMLHRALEYTGYSIITAESGQQGLVYAGLAPVALIILDIMLAGYLDGQQVLARLKGDPATAPIPVIVMSAYTNEERIQELLASGAALFVAKPFDVSTLISAVKSVLHAGSQDAA